MSLTPRIDLIEELLPIKYQKKTLTANLGADNADIADLRFNNLEIGKTYRLSGQARIQRNPAVNQNGGASLTALHDGNNILFFETNATMETAIESVRCSYGNSVVFIATATTIVFSLDIVSSFGILFQDQTFMTLEELPNHVVTTDWT